MRFSLSVLLKSLKKMAKPLRIILKYRLNIIISIIWIKSYEISHEIYKDSG